MQHIRYNTYAAIAAFTALITAISLIITTPTAFAQVSGSSAITSDKVAFAQQIGLMDNVNEVLDVDRVMTRGEFAHLCSNLLNQPQYKTEKSSYSDVSTKNKHFAEIQELTDMGYLSGSDDHLFSPDEPIKINDAVCVLVKILGYQADALVKGGYPFGYVTIAQRIGLLDGVDTSSLSLTNGQATVIAYNCCNTALKTEQELSDDSVYYVVNDQKTLLSEYHNIYTVSGMVEDIGYQTVDCDGFLQIGSERYHYDKNQQWSGDFVKLYYYDVGNGAKKYVQYVEQDDSYERIKFSTENISFADNTYTDYADGNRNRTATIDGDSWIFYNGKKLSGSDYSQYGIGIMTPDMGEITIVRYAGKCVSVQITSYTNIFVSRINRESETVFDKYNSDRNLCYGDINYTMVDKFGEPADMVNVFASSVLSVAQSLDGEIAYIIYGFDAVYGDVSDIANNADEIEISVKGNSYKVDSRIKSKFLSAVTVRTNGAFYLDVYGKVAGFNVYENGLQCGLLIDVARQNSSLENGLRTRILGEDGVIHYLDTCSKLKIDGNIETEDSAEQILKNIILDKNQVIRYMVNQQEEIIQIDTAYTDTPNRSETEDSLYNYCNNSSAVYMSTNMKFGKSVVIDMGTLIFSVPDKDGYCYDWEYGVIDSGYFTNALKYNIHAYKCDPQSFFASAIVVETGEQTSLLSTSPYLLVNQVKSSVDKREENTIVLKGYANGKEVEYEIPKVILSELQSTLGRMPMVGDIYRFSLNSDNKIGIVTVIWKGDNGYVPASNPSSSDVRNSARNLKGYVHSFDGTYIRVVTDKSIIDTASDGDLEMFNASKFKIYVCGKGKNKDEFYPGDESDIVTYQENPVSYPMVFIHTYYGSEKELVIYYE